MALLRTLNCFSSSFGWNSVTFRISRRWRKKIVVTRTCLRVCLKVCGRMPTLLHRPGCNLGNGMGCPLVVHYYADLQSVRVKIPEFAGLEIARLENDGQYRRCGNCRTGKWRTKSQGWKMTDWKMADWKWWTEIWQTPKWRTENFPVLQMSVTHYWLWRFTLNLNAKTCCVYFMFYCVWCRLRL